MESQGQPMTQPKKNPLDSYTLYARVFPALISALPLFILWYFISTLGELSGLVSYVFSLKFLGSVTFGVVFLYFYAQVIRTASKFLETRYFLKEKGFPTTYLMLYRDSTYSRNYKDTYRARVTKAFGITLPTEEDEKEDLEETKKRLHEITKYIILQLGSGHLVLKHNVWYGFFRNLVGGALFSSLFCILNIYIGVFSLNNPTLWATSIVLLICFAFLLLWRKSILVQQAKAYAKQLIAEFMENNKGEQSAAPDGGSAGGVTPANEP